MMKILKTLQPFMKKNPVHLCPAFSKEEKIEITIQKVFVASLRISRQPFQVHRASHRTPFHHRPAQPLRNQVSFAPTRTCLSTAERLRMISRSILRSGHNSLLLLFISERATMAAAIAAPAAGKYARRSVTAPQPPARRCCRRHHQRPRQRAAMEAITVSPTAPAGRALVRCPLPASTT